MSINVTLIIQMLVFACFVWFTMSFVWPPLQKALAARQAKIAEGLAAGERGQRELELAHHRAVDELKEAKHQANEIIEKASLRAAQIIEEAKEQAKIQADHAAKVAADHLVQEVNRARETLHKEIGRLAVAGAEKILKQEIDESRNRLLIDDLIQEI
ncbi:MAG: F0F1 ATP synthase subunit B [Legionellales bacterium]|nr:F0F1 ATP synthase subunit B [Legionellales bacterium]